MFRQDRTNPNTAVTDWRGNRSTPKAWPNTAISTWLNGGLFGAAVPLTAFGGRIRQFDYGGKTWRSHEFLGDSVFWVVEGSANVGHLVVAGGGAGGHATSGSGGGGGGGGGVRFDATTLTEVTATGGPSGDGKYPIVVGVGGAGTGSTGWDPAPDKAIFEGATSSALGFSATGGGYGGNSGSNGDGSPGGSGGGAFGGHTNYDGGTGNEGGYSPVEGYKGGDAATSYNPGSGGGGQSGAGSTGYSSGGAGGYGLTFYYRTGTYTYVGAGGGGAAASTPQVGGGNQTTWGAGSSGQTAGTSAAQGITANLPGYIGIPGLGGAAGGSTGPSWTGGALAKGAAGGSGVVVLFYEVA